MIGNDGNVNNLDLMRINESIEAIAIEIKLSSADVVVQLASHCLLN